MAAGGAFFFPGSYAGALVVYAAIRAWRLKTVAVSRCDLVISHFGRIITVPAIQVSEITGGRQREPIRLRFYEPTEFGDSIEFIPPEPVVFTWPSKPHPLINELEQLCGLSSGRANHD